MKKAIIIGASVLGGATIVGGAKILYDNYKKNKESKEEATNPLCSAADTESSKE